MNLKSRLILATIGITVIALFIGLMAFAWRNDVSDQEQFSGFLNRPLEIKRAGVIIKKEGRFADYGMDSQEALANFTAEQLLNPGDKLEFYAAKSYYSIHVGTSYYLLGRDTLSSGEVVSFEYFLSDYSPRIWETLAEFLERKEQENILKK
ncbi:hypothetical protein [uncultured Arcticibacterium sp.]|uniref:hypothetical protein n=1 Tax=uncultured Arcticibacterium sp. TaxID=2173042 RepID=UPI0030FB6A32